MSVSSATYHLQIYFTGSYVTVSNSYALSHISISRNLAAFGRNVSEGRADLAIDNTLGHFSPANSASPYYGSLIPGKTARILAVYNTTTYTLFQGYVKAYRASHALGQQQANIALSDEIYRIRTKKIDTTLRENIAVGSLTALVLSTASVSTFAIDAISGADSIGFASYDGVSALQALNQIVEYGDYVLFTDRTGAVTLKNRNYHYGLTAVASYSTAWYLGTHYDAENITNKFSITGQQLYSHTDVSSICYIENPITIPASSTYSLWLNYLDPTNKALTQAKNVATPVSGTDFQAISANSAFDFTSNLSINFTAYGRSCVCSITNTVGSDTILTLYAVQGVVVENIGQFRIDSNVASSQTTYGVYETSDKAGALRNNTLFDSVYAQYIVDKYHDPRHFVDVQIKNDYPGVITNDLSDLINLVNSHAGLTGSEKLRINEITHNITAQRGVEHVASYVCELVTTPSSAFYLDSSTLNGTDILIPL